MKLNVLVIHPITLNLVTAREFSITNHHTQRYQELGKVWEFFCEAITTIENALTCNHFVHYYPPKQWAEDGKLLPTEGTAVLSNLNPNAAYLAFYNSNCMQYHNMTLGFLKRLFPQSTTQAPSSVSDVARDNAIKDLYKQYSHCRFCIKEAAGKVLETQIILAGIYRKYIVDNHVEKDTTPAWRLKRGEVGRTLADKYLSDSSVRLFTRANNIVPKEVKESADYPIAADDTEYYQPIPTDGTPPKWVSQFTSPLNSAETRLSLSWLLPPEYRCKILST